MSLVFVPTLLMWLQPEPGIAPQERYLVGPMRRVARFSMRHARPVSPWPRVGLMALAAVGATRLRVDTNHINFFAEDHPLHQSAAVIDEKLSGIYSFNILLEGAPDSMKSPDALRRMEELRARLEQLPFVRKVVSVADYVKRVNRELTRRRAGGGGRAGERRGDCAGAVRLRAVRRGPARAGARGRQRLLARRRSR